MTKNRWARIAFVLLVILTAFAFRVCCLTSQGLWHDEGLSWYLARGSISSLLSGTSHTEHPPLYFLLLHFWMGAAGESEFALRYLSVLWGTLSVALTAALGRRILGWRAAVAASALMAISPFQVWYSQEVRGYAMLTALTLLLGYLFLHAARSERPRDWIGYAATAVASMYTHLLSGLLLAFHFAWGAATAKRKRRVVTLAIVGAAVVVPFVPWFGAAMRQWQENATYWQGTLDVSKALLEIVASEAVGLTAGNGLVEKAASVLLLAAVAYGLIARAEDRERSARWFLLLAWALPLAAFLAVAYHHPKFAPRYLIFLAPYAYLLAARAASRLPGRVLLLALALPMVFSLRNMYAGVNARLDFRGVVGYIDAHAAPNDAILLVGGHMEPVIRYYEHRGLAIYPLPRGIMADVMKPVTPQEVADVLNEISKHHDGVWLVLWQENLADPMRLTFSQLMENAPRQPVAASFRDIALLKFSLANHPHFSAVPDIRRPMHEKFDAGLALVGYDITRWGDLPERQQEWLKHATQVSDKPVFHPGDTIHVSLYWERWGDVRLDYTVFTHLLSMDGKVYGQMDRRLGDDLFPSSRWPMGQVYRESYPLPIAKDTPPGDYWIEVGLYFSGTMQRAHVLSNGADRLLLGPVEILP